MSGAKKAILRSGGWIRPKFEFKSDTALVAALTDAWWPAVFTAVSTPRPMGTIAFCLDFIRSAKPTNTAFFLEVCTEDVADGYAVEFDRLWDEEGRLLATAQQNIAIIR